MDERFRVRLKLNKSQFSSAIKSMLPEVGAVEGRSREWIEEDSENFYFYIGAADRNISFPFLLTWTGKCRSLTPTLDRAIL